MRTVLTAMHSFIKQAFRSDSKLSNKLVFHMNLKVNEIFYSIQGESLYSGLPCLFVRLTGCNLRCTYCDTQYAYDEGHLMSVTQIIEHLSQYRCKLVEITGGEPLCQSATPLLITHLIENGYTVLLETNGSKDIKMADPRCIKIVDIKCPGSGESENNDLENLNRLSSNDQLKFVITDRQDYDYAKEIIHSAWPGPYPVPILFSAVSQALNHAILAEWILADNLDVRLQVQLHKILWPNEDKGR